VKLSAQLPIRGDRIDYSYDTLTGEHTAIFSMSGKVYTGSAGAIASVLAPYREYVWVRELFSWLVK
jgi:hypothetical protein